MARLAAVVLGFWTFGCVLGAAFSLVVAIAPGSRKPLVLPLALLALAVIFGRAAIATWRPAPRAPLALRQAAALSGPLFGVIVWSTSTPGQLPGVIVPVVLGWALFAAVTLLLAHRLSATSAGAPAA